MKNQLFFLLILIGTITSCQKQVGLEKDFTEELGELSTQFTFKEGDSIIPLDSTLFPKKPESNFQPYSAYEHLSELEGLTFFLSPKSVYQGLNTLQTTGLGQEIVLGSRSSGNDAQLFYLEFLPATSGIPYLIRSFDLGEVVGAGSYESDPGNYVLYTRQAGEPNLFGFSWDFYLNDAEDGFLIENQDLIGSGPGGPGDIYYYSLEAQLGNVNFVKTSPNSIYQQFNILVNDDFNIQSVELNVDNAVITGTEPYLIKDGTAINNTSNNMSQTLTFTESEGETSSFREANGITTEKTGSLNIGISLFEVVNIGGSYTVQTGASQTIEYGLNKERSISVTDSYEIIIPPNTTVTYKFKATRHTVDLPYTATLYGVNSTSTMDITGMYSGVAYSSTYLEVKETPNDGKSGTTRTYTIQGNMK